MKNWIDDNPYNYSSFYISKIADGVIEGKFLTTMIAKFNENYYLPKYKNEMVNLNGTINKDTAECQFTESNGNKGNVKLVFKTNEIEATIKYTHKLEIFDYLSLDGNFLFEPYNLKAINRFSPIKDQCFTVDLNSWGNVNFVSGKVSGEKRIVNVFFLEYRNL